MNKVKYLALLLIFVLSFALFPDTILIYSAHAAETHRIKTSFLKGLKAKIGKNDAVVVASPTGKILLSKNGNKRLIPASTLKVLTSLAAFNTLGKDFRFKTEFYLSPANDLKIKGYGDPLLISEAIDLACFDIANVAANRIKSEINGTAISKALRFKSIIVDDTYFKTSIDIPGILEADPTNNPYDAPLGALSVNFNTIFFINGKSEHPLSAESQTPLLPFVLGWVKESGLDKGRIILSHKGGEPALYAGALFAYFLEKHGVKNINGVSRGKVNLEDRLIYTYTSIFTLEEAVQRLLRFSNNFMANQVVLAIGAKVANSSASPGSSPQPGDIKKGVAQIRAYAAKELGIINLPVVEGSGISRQSRISGREMLKVLEKFAPHKELMRNKGVEYYKTGTLNGIRTRVGYIKNDRDEYYRYVIFFNTKGKSSTRFAGKLIKGLTP